jgi:DNA-binding protein H-NS
MKEFTDRLAEIEAEKAAVLADMEQEKVRKKQEVIKQCRDLIAESDMDVDEIVDALKAEKAEKPRRTRTVTVYALNTDQSLRYSSGRVPTWMKDHMSSYGLDSGNAGDRERYKEQFMTVVGATQ